MREQAGGQWCHRPLPCWMARRPKDLASHICLVGTAPTSRPLPCQAWGMDAISWCATRAQYDTGPSLNRCHFGSSRQYQLHLSFDRAFPNRHSKRQSPPKAITTDKNFNGDLTINTSSQARINLDKPCCTWIKCYKIWRGVRFAKVKRWYNPFKEAKALCFH